nr:DUF3604 domain-containing protein [Myxococcota bacterium]
MLVGATAGCGGPPADVADFLPDEVSGTPAPKVCLDTAPLRVALFGDLHVHTALSSDAWNYDVQVRPHDAYGYAFGQPIDLPPNDASGRGTRRVSIDRPLDFAAVTDHAEFLGEQRLCSDPESVGYMSETCVEIRASSEPVDSPLAAKIMLPWPSREADLCGPDGEVCLEASLSAWDEIIAAAEAWNDPG